jgi:transcriptional regulator with XRE-family HTH domain
MYRRIRDLREDKDLTQKQVAKAINCSQQVYSNYELGQRDIPTQMLLALACFHGTSVDYLLGNTDISAPYPTPDSTPARHRQSQSK